MNMMTKKWKLFGAILPGIILLILVYTIGIPYPQTRPAITVLTYLYMLVGPVLVVYNIFKGRKK